MSTFLTLIFLASAITVAQIFVGVNWRRANGSRRWVFVIGGILNSMLVIPVGFMAVRYVRGIDSVAILIVAGIVLFLSLVALRHGLRGRRVGDHPHCRRCGFDLFGKPETSTQCPECGANLDEDHATVIGVRKRRPALIFGALFLMLVSLGVGVPVATKMKINWNQYKPDWWLVMQWNSNRWYNSPIGSSVNDELGFRLQNGDLSRFARERMARELIKRAKVGKSVGSWANAIMASAAVSAIDEKLLCELTREKLNIAWSADPIVEYGREIPLIQTTYFSGATIVSVADSVNGIPIPKEAVRDMPPISYYFGAAPGDSKSSYVLDLGSIWNQLSAVHDQPFDFVLMREVKLRESIRNGSQVLDEEWTVTLQKKMTSIPKGISKSRNGTSQIKAIVRRAWNEAWFEFEIDGKPMPVPERLSVFIAEESRPSLLIGLGSLQTTGQITASDPFPESALDSRQSWHLEIFPPGADFAYLAPQNAHRKYVVDTIIDEGITP